MFKIEFQGNDVIVRNVIVTCFGGGSDKGDDGKTESGVMNDGSDPNLLGCALPIRSTENATRFSPLADAQKAHIPWGTIVHFWKGSDESTGIDTVLIDNGPNVAKYPTHAGDLTVAAAHFFNSTMPLSELANNFESILSYRIVNGAKYCNIANE